MHLCAHLTSMRVHDGALRLQLRCGDHDVVVRAVLGGAESHALHHAHASLRLRSEHGDALLALLRAVSDAAGGAVTAIVVDLRGEQPAFRLRVGSPDRSSEVPISVHDAVLLLAPDDVRVEVVTPTIPTDWDAALEQLVREEA